MSLSDMEVDRGFDHQDHMGTEAWRIGVVTRIETGPIVRPDYGPTGSGAPVLAALLGVVALVGILAGITAGILAVAS